MPRTFRRALIGAALSLALAAACGYSPNPEDGTLKCGSSNACPDGYSCRSGACWKNGGTGRAGTGGGGSAGTTGNGGTGGGSVAKFVGHWVFNGPQSSRTRECTDGSKETTTPWEDYFDVATGPVAALSTDYYCTWNLDVASNGNSTTIRPGGMCTKPDPGIPTTSYTWHGESFTLTTTNGLSGMLEASLPYDYTTALGSGSCTMKFTGPVTKQ
jgi:hypothetical protein